MKLAIIGLPQSGKSTVYNALTKKDETLSVSGTRVEVHSAMVNVPDETLLDLANLYSSKKIVHAQIAFADVAGFGAGGSGESLSGQLLNALSGMDGLMIVLRNFADDSVPHIKGSIDPARDLAALLEDLMLNDLIVAERKIERLAEERQKSGRDSAAIEKEKAFFEKVLEALNHGTPLRDQALSEDEKNTVSGLGFLTHKVVLAVQNNGEDQEDSAIQHEGIKTLSLLGKLEMELAQLPDEEAGEFLSEYGISESGGQRIIRAAYEMLNTQSFYTAAESEAHAWMLQKGSSALKAAHTIHSDIARGFIRAEIIHASDLLELGSLANARDVGKLRLEGKDYPMRDGDVINVRFNV